MSVQEWLEQEMSQAYETKGMDRYLFILQELLELAELEQDGEAS